MLTWAEYGAAIDENDNPVTDYQAQGEAYWFGSRNDLTPLSHQAGYSDWSRTNYLRTDYGLFEEESIARRNAEAAIDPSPVPYFDDLISAMTGRFNVNLSYVELGCGPGPLVYYGRQHGLDAYGVEVSQYAVEQGELMFPGVSTYITVQDALSWLQSQKRNSWNVIITRGFLPCFDDNYLNGNKGLIAEMNKVAQRQIHLILPVPSEFYNLKTIPEWASNFDWNQGTAIVNGNDLTYVLT